MEKTSRGFSIYGRVLAQQPRIRCGLESGNR